MSILTTYTIDVDETMDVTTNSARLAEEWSRKGSRVTAVTFER